jgi:hypothetical protein
VPAKRNLASLFVVSLTVAAASRGASAATATPVAAAVTHAVQPNVNTTLFVQVLPKSKCLLGDGTSSQGLHLYAFENGIVHFDITAPQKSATTLYIDCQGLDGTSMRYPVILSPTADPVAISATQASFAPLAQSKNGTPRPPLTGDPMSYTSGELLAKGYGRRPDPVKTPAYYATWLQHAQQPGTIVSSLTIPGDASHGVNENKKYNEFSGGGGWSGPVDTTFGGDLMVDALAQWYVPQGIAEGCWNCFSNASTWAGLGGRVDQPLWQIGTEEKTSNVLGFKSSSYYAWYQLWPNNSTDTVLNMSVNNGDQVNAEVWVCDPANFYEITAPSTTGSKLCGYMANYTRSEFWQPNAVYPCSGSGGVCNGSGNSFGTAEVIQEWDNNGRNDYTAFNTFKFLYTQAFDLPEYGNYSTGLGAYGNDPFTTTMFQIGSSSHLIGGSCIGDATPVCDDMGQYIWVWWKQRD